MAKFAMKGPFIASVGQSGAAIVRSEKLLLRIPQVLLQSRLGGTEPTTFKVPQDPLVALQERLEERATVLGQHEEEPGLGQYLSHRQADPLAAGEITERLMERDTRGPDNLPITVFGSGATIAYRLFDPGKIHCGQLGRASQRAAFGDPPHDVQIRDVPCRQLAHEDAAVEFVHREPFVREELERLAQRVARDAQGRADRRRTAASPVGRRLR